MSDYTATKLLGIAGMLSYAAARLATKTSIVDYNLPSLLSHRRMRFATVGHITTVRFFRWQYLAEGIPKFVRIDRGAPAEMRMPLPASSAALV